MEEGEFVNIFTCSFSSTCFPVFSKLVLSVRCVEYCIFRAEGEDARTPSLTLNGLTAPNYQHVILRNIHTHK